MKKTSLSGFTLIELLIVVAIIAVLAAIAVPNFLEAQTRSRVSRVKADMRSLGTALEAYRVDHNDYVPGLGRWDTRRLPPDDIIPGDPPGGYGFEINRFVKWRCAALTSPVAYMSSLPGTPFLPKEYWHSGGIVQIRINLGFEYDQFPIGLYNNPPIVNLGSRPGTTRWHFRDAGPDYNFNNRDQNYVTSLAPYDPTNGTVSLGDIWRFGP